MEPYESNQNPFISAHLPLTLLAGAAALFFVSQLDSISQGTDSINWQTSNADKVIKNLGDAKVQLNKTVEDRKALVAQSEQLQKQFSDLMRELDELARGGDKDADLIIKGYGIKVGDAPAGEKPAAEKPAEKPVEKP